MANILPFEDPVEKTRPRRADCLSCKKPINVKEDGTLEEHSIADTQISADQKYYSTVEQACPVLEPKFPSGSELVMEDESYYIMYDCELRKPGCVLLQALGGTVPKDLFFQYFGEQCWLLAPTPNMRLYPIKKSQLSYLAEMTDFT